MCARVVEVVDFSEDRLRERGSLPATFYVLTRVFPMANDNSRKFKPVSYTHLDVYKRQNIYSATRE